MTRAELDQYLERVRTACRVPFYVERFFRTEEEWERVAGYDFRTVSFSDRAEANFDRIVSRRAAILLGEPGAGKSTVSRAIVERAIAKGQAPILTQLRSYKGNLRGLLEASAPIDLLAPLAIDGATVSRVLVLDGVDEVPQTMVDRFVTELEALLDDGSFEHTVLTSRQAFFAANRSRFRNPPPAFYLLGFNEKNVRAYVEHHGGMYDAFRAEVARVRMGSEISNPFTLEVIFKTFTETGSLGTLRSQAVDHVVESLIASRPQVAADRQRRALRMLAVAMESASRNELTIQEAVQLLQSATRLAAPASEALLDELTHSILVRTGSGVSFQMRSYGEYLAALELKDMSLDRVQSLVNHDGTLIPNESWRNCVSYLAELSPAVRRSFTLKNPDWMISVSPGAFTDAERTTLMTRLLNRLAENHEFIRRHRFIDAEAVARFITPAIERQLAVDAVGADEVRVGNALAVLGACRDANAVQIALPIAFDITRSEALRESAFGAIAAGGTAALIPTLLQHQNQTDPLNLTLIDCIGALVDAPSIATVIPVLLGTDAMVSSAFYRFRDLQTHDAIEAMLDVLVANPALIQHNRFDTYAEPLWEAMPRLWDAAWLPKVVSLIVAWENGNVHEREAAEFVQQLQELPDHGAQVARDVLRTLLQRAQNLFYFSRPLSGLITADVATWLAQQPNATALMRTAARFGSDEVRQALAPHMGGFVEEQAQAIARVRAQDRRRQARDEQRVAAQQDVVRTNQNFASVLGVLAKLNSKDWPEVNRDRQTWFGEQAEDWLQRIDPLTNVTWLSENQLSYNPALTWIIRVVDHYAARIANDVLLVQSLLAAEGNHIAGYYRRHGLSAAALAEFERMLADPATPGGALYHFLSVLASSDIASAAIGRTLLVIAEDALRPDHIRAWALRLANTKGAADGDLIGLAGRTDAVQKEQIERFLIERGHRPTIERRIAALLADDATMQAGEVQFPHESTLSWIASIGSDVYWGRLEQLRAQSLRLALPSVAGLVTSTMNKIDGVRLAATVRQQLPITPAAWRDVQEMRAIEYEREARLRAAQGTPFQQVVQRLRRVTSLAMFKVWCEGLTDGPTLEELLKNLPGYGDVDIVSQSLGGWNNILSPNWRPDRLADGCHDLVVLLDGDKGRDFNAAGRPLNANAQRIRQILADAGIELIVLERHGMENYLSQAACEAVLGPRAAAAFPLPPYAAPNIPQHTKNQNPRIAKLMTRADLIGTDLLNILERIIERSRV